MILVTVGTLLPFDRLVREIDRLAADGHFVGEEVFVQKGVGGYEPKHVRWTEALDRADFRRLATSSRAIVSHAGMGTIIQALNQGKPMLVVPRRRHLRENVNDHQLATARRFEADGQVLAAYDISELGNKLAALATFRPAPRDARPDLVVARISSFVRTQTVRS